MAPKKRLSGAAVSSTGGTQPKRAKESPAPAAAVESRRSAGPTAIVGVGASAGGIEAFTALLKELPPDTGLAFVFVQHLAPTHTSMLAEILQRATRMRVLEVHDEPVVERDCVYVIPPARVMTIRNGRLELTPRGQAPQHPIDDFFDSLATTQGHRAIGVVLSGTASDGTAGLAAIKAAGGITIAQDSSALYDGMPRSAVTAGRVDFVLPPAGIARELARIAHHPYVAEASEEAESREELNRVNNDLNNLFGSLQMAIVMVWQDLRIRRFTPMAEKLFNLIVTDIGRPIGDINLNLTVHDLPKLLAEVIDQVTARDLEVQDQAGRWYQLRIRPYRTLDNRIDGAVILLFDIESLKQTQGVLERQAKLLEQTHEAVFVRDLNGAIVYWNRGAELLYGFVREEAVGRLSHELLGKNPKVRSQINEALQSEGRWLGEMVHRTKDGRELTIDCQEMLISEADRRLVLSTNRDVTERKRLEETLHRRVDELAEADRHKSEFLAVLAHELRNPLAPLRNAIEILKSVPGADPRAERAKELIERQARTLTRLVDDLLDTARISRGQVQLRREAIDLQPVVTRAVETAREAIDSRHHGLTVSLPPEPIKIVGDATRLEQVLANLLNNAAKYTPEGGQITVSAVKTNSGSAPEVVVRIRDTGIGISKEMLPRVFDLFAQADRSLAHSQGGLGIGLSLVRSLVELHGGRVVASSDGLGKGSEFAVYLPTTPLPAS